MFSEKSPPNSSDQSDKNLDSNSPARHERITNIDDRKFQKAKAELEYAISQAKKQDREKLITAIFYEFFGFSINNEEHTNIIKNCTNTNKIIKELFKVLKKYHKDVVELREGVCELIEHLHINHSALGFKEISSELRVPKKEVDILIVAAMAEELRELLKYQRGWSYQEIKTKIQKKTIYTRYYKRCFRDFDNNKFTVAAAHAGGKGVKYTAILATHLVVELEPSYLIMIGICAGNSKRTQKGDVIVADKIFDTGGEIRASSEILGNQKIRTEEVRPKPDSGKPPEHLIILIRDFIRQWEAPEDRPIEHQDYPDNSEIKRDVVHIRPMATVDKVQRDPDLFDTLAQQYCYDVIAVDMESAAIYAVAEKYEIKQLVIKGVQDYADIAKDEQFRQYAAKASARFSIDFLRKTHTVSRLLNT